MASTRTDSDRIPLMLIHGAWLSSRSWENFADYFEKRGFAVSAPEWPRKEGDVEELRAETDELEGLGIEEIVDHYEEQIRALDEPPVLVGHSFGGLIVELLLDRGLGRAGVALSPAPPKGILVLPFSSLKAAAPALAHPSKLARNRPADARGVHVRVREHVLSRGRRGRVRALRGSGDGPDLLRGGVRELPPAPADRGALQERRIARRCSSSGRRRTTRCRPRSPRSSTRSTSARRRRRSTSSSRAGRI